MTFFSHKWQSKIGFKSRNKTNLIWPLIAASHPSENFWRARESWGMVGTRSSSFFTSSKGSKTTPNRDWLSSLDVAETENPPPFLAWENRRMEIGEDDKETEGNRGLKLSPREQRREEDGEILRSMVLEIAQKQYEEINLKSAV